MRESLSRGWRLRNASAPRPDATNRLLSATKTKRTRHQTRYQGWIEHEHEYEHEHEHDFHTPPNLPPTTNPNHQPPTTKTVAPASPFVNFEYFVVQPPCATFPALRALLSFVVNPPRATPTPPQKTPFPWSTVSFRGPLTRATFLTPSFPSVFVLNPRVQGSLLVRLALLCFAT